MEHTTVNIEGKPHPLNEDQTQVHYNLKWREILEDQEGKKHFLLYKKGKTRYVIYLDEQPQDESQKELFTGGEWVGERHNNPDYIDIEGNSRICSILINAHELEEIGSSVEEAEANAALIAASKNMYYTLKITNQNLGNLIQWMDEGKEFDPGEILSAIRNDINGLLKKIHP